VRAALSEWFILTEPVHRPYLYRWGLPALAHAEEERLISVGRLPATGVRFIATRK
jgi:hypothetical protein